MSNVYRVKNWNEFFEGAKSRTYQNKTSCTMPTKHGLGFKRLIRRKNGASLFGAWCALIQVLSRHAAPRDGWITDTGRADGKPLSHDDLECLTDIKAEYYAEMLEICSKSEINWVTDTTRIPDGYHTDTMGAVGIPSVPPNSDSDSDSDLDLKPTVVPVERARPESFKQWTESDLLKSVEESNADNLLSDENALDFVGYWTCKTASGKYLFTTEKTWDTRRRMKNAERMIYRGRNHVSPKTATPKAPSSMTTDETNELNRLRVRVPELQALVAAGTATERDAKFYGIMAEELKRLEAKAAE